MVAAGETWGVLGRIGIYQSSCYLGHLGLRQRLGVIKVIGLKQSVLWSWS